MKISFVQLSHNSVVVVYSFGKLDSICGKPLSCFYPLLSATATWRVGTPDPSISEVKQRAVRTVLGWESPTQERPDCCSLTKLSTKSSSGRDVKRGSRARGGASTTLNSLITHTWGTYWLAKYTR